MMRYRLMTALLALLLCAGAALAAADDPDWRGDIFEMKPARGNYVLTEGSAESRRYRSRDDDESELTVDMRYRIVRKADRQKFAEDALADELDRKRWRLSSVKPVVISGLPGFELIADISEQTKLGSWEVRSQQLMTVLFEDGNADRGARIFTLSGWSGTKDYRRTIRQMRDVVASFRLTGRNDGARR